MKEELESLQRRMAALAEHLESSGGAIEPLTDEFGQLRTDMEAFLLRYHRVIRPEIRIDLERDHGRLSDAFGFIRK